MPDAIYMLIALIFFAVAIRYVKACDNLRGKEND